MTNAELGVKIIDIKLAILKIISKTSEECKSQYLDLKKHKEKKIVEVGMAIQRGQSIDSFIDIMTLTSIINNETISVDDKVKVINLSPDTFESLKATMDENTAKTIKELQDI